MSFLFPSVLFALFAITIPILIHLFSFRKHKRIFFSTIAFLKNLQEESESKSRLKQWLILLSRIFAFTAIVFAFSQPFLPAANAKVKVGNKVVSVYVDNSFSMDSEGKEGMLIESAKKKAREIASLFGNSDRFQLLSNEFEGKQMRLLTKEEFIKAVDELKTGSSTRFLSEVVNRQYDILRSSNETDKRSFLITDFQKSICDFDNIKGDTTIAGTFIPLEAPGKGNVLIDSCWFETPVQQEGMLQHLHVRIKNLSESSIENASVKLIINGKLVSPATFTCPIGQSVEVSMAYLIREKGLQKAVLEIEDHPISFDDKLYFSYKVSANISCLVISGKNSESASFFKTLMAKDSLFHYTEMDDQNIDYGKFGSQRLIVLNGLKSISSGLSDEVIKFVKKGSSVLIFPGDEIDFASYSNILTKLSLPALGVIDTFDTKVDRINFDQGLFEGVFEKKSERMDMPVIFNHYLLSNQSKNAESILTLENGNPFLVLSRSQGQAYLFSASLTSSQSNFARHALFVPTIIRIALSSEPFQELYYYTNLNKGIPLINRDEEKEAIVHVVSADGKNDFIPSIRKSENEDLLFIQNQVQLSGNYDLKSDKETIGCIAFNYDRKESDLSSYTISNLKEKMIEKNIEAFEILDLKGKSADTALAEMNNSKKLWKLFIVLALAFLVIESLLIRFVK